MRIPAPLARLAHPRDASTAAAAGGRPATLDRVGRRARAPGARPRANFGGEPVQTEILYQPAYSVCRVTLRRGEQIRAEAGAMVSMAGVEIETGATGGF